MNEKLFIIGQKLISTGKLSTTEYKYLIDNRNEEITELLKNEAVKKRKEIYGNTVFIRGLIEISNICKNDCLYCGIRASNKECERYRLTKEEILSCCDEGYSLGFRTFVMQGGEDLHFTDDLLVEIIGEIKKKYPDCAITLSLGERSYESYKKLYDAGADRYLLRHETADEEHYNKLHPFKMNYKTRMECLKNLKEIGFQTGCGFMVGSPHQTTENLAKDLKFIEEFSPQMCGIGPFIPHKATDFRDEPSGDVELTCFLLSIIRLIKPTILLPATTALGSAEQGGREKGILCGANVIMPNLSPHSVRKKYELYNNKLISGNESAQEIENLKNSMKNIGYKIVTDRGDIKEK
ncbi:MAG: [Clostridia bacterium]|nr:[FeFe] hydrogenase H-cluster radical SAM maturase HydE [Clostridia bacterium]